MAFFQFTDVEPGILFFSALAFAGNFILRIIIENITAAIPSIIFPVNFSPRKTILLLLPLML